MSEAELARLSAAVSHPIGEPHVDGAVVYAPVGAVDCVGVLLDRATDRIVVLGSAVSLETYVWAHQQRFALHAANTLAITAVRDHAGAIALFRMAYPPRYVRDELGPQLLPPRLPARIELDWPATALLLEPLRHTDTFDYQVNPT